MDRRLWRLHQAVHRVPSFSRAARHCSRGAISSGDVRPYARDWNRPQCRASRPGCQRAPPVPADDALRPAAGRGARAEQGGLVRAPLVPGSADHRDTERAGLGGTGRVADDLYLMAHHEVSGRPLLQPRALGTGLAAALLAELTLGGSIVMRPGGTVAACRARPADDLARRVHDQVTGEPELLAVPEWLLFLARTAAQDVAARLDAVGIPDAGWRPPAVAGAAMGPGGSGLGVRAADPGPLGAGPGPALVCSRGGAGRAGGRVRAGVPAGPVPGPGRTGGGAGSPAARSGPARADRPGSGGR